ncbi:MAG TPA: FMN-dependent NADH-azoreductase [Methylocella sp.]|nr:FMN-dependent NADH-azoreductase [Methylocella sp.]
MKLLHVDSSILGAHSISRQLSAEIVAKLRQVTPNLEITYRDLAAEPVPHLSGSTLAARQPAAGQPSAEVEHDLVLSARVLDEFLAADIVVVGAPMYNFGVPSQLKAWIDRLLIAGKTFRYSEKGVEGLASGKRVIIASSRGGIYSEGAPAAPAEHQETYLRSVFAFIGIPDIEIVRTEGVAIGPQPKAEAIAAAKREIANLKAA